MVSLMARPCITGVDVKEELDPVEKGVVDDGTRKSETRYELEHDRGVHHCQEGAGHLAQKGSVASCHLAQLRGQKVTVYQTVL